MPAKGGDFFRLQLLRNTHPLLVPGRYLSQY